MRNYKYKGEIETLRTLPSEITVGEFQKITKLQDGTVGDYNYYLSVFSVLGLSDQLIDDLDDTALIEIIKDFQTDFIVDNSVYEQIAEVNGTVYFAYEDKFSMKARMFADIEERMKLDNVEWITYALARIFLVEDRLQDHNDAKHISNKCKSMKDMTMDVALPYIFYISEKYISNVKILINND